MNDPYGNDPYGNGTLVPNDHWGAGCKPGCKVHGLDAGVQPDPAIRELIKDALKAEEHYSLDELEAHARGGPTPHEH